MRKRGHNSVQRRRGDTVAVNAALVRRRLGELGSTQADFAADHDIPQRTFERALGGGRVLKVLVVRIAAGLKLRYADIVAAGDARALRVTRRTSFAPPGTANGAGSRARNRKLVQSANKLRSEFQRATEGRRPPLGAAEFGTAAALIDAIWFLDPNNGHAHYYAGEVKRWMGRREESHQHFFRYLDSYQEVFAPIRESDAGLEHCYRTAHGYCRERTAWVHHLLALDLWRQGRARKDRGILEHARRHANDARDLFPGGFIQFTSTTKLLEAMQRATAKTPLNNHTISRISSDERFVIEAIKTARHVPLETGDSFSCEAGLPLIAMGRTLLPDTKFVWVVLVDHFGNSYLQYPPAKVGSGSWTAANIRPLGEINRIEFILVGAGGNEQFLGKVARNEWGKLDGRPADASELAFIELA